MKQNAPSVCVWGIVSGTIPGILCLFMMNSFLFVVFTLLLYFFGCASFFSYTLIYFIVFSELYVVKHTEYIV